MIAYLVKILVLALFSFVVIYYYYFTNSAHIENFDWYISYVIIIWIIYSIYKFFQLEFSDKKASFTPIKLLGFFLLHLLILSILFFTLNWSWFWSWITLFFKIVYYLILPITIILSSLSFWKKIISYFSFINMESSIYKFIISLWIWFFSFLFLLDIFWILGFYNLYVVFLILLWFVTFSYREFISLYKWIFDYKIEFDIEEWSYMKLITAEFLFLVSTLLLSVNLISIVRPFPIWWDDLWAYMNYAHLMAESGNVLLWWMLTWESFTGIGYMFWSPTQAFFLNNVWWFLSFILLVLITSDLLKSTQEKDKKLFISIPMFVWTIFISLPMIVFQQAKDMKLDSWLFFVSIIVVYLLFKYYLNLDNKTYLEKAKWFINDKILHRWFHFNNLLIIFIIWLLAGFTFSIKVISLILISAIIWVIAYVRLGLMWFAWYVAIFFAIFTKAKLWWMMNVVVNPSNIPWFENKFFIISWLIWVLLLGYSFIKNKFIVKKFFLEFGIFLLWLIIALSPWIWKNIYETYPNISLWGILSWKSDSFVLDYTKIHTQQDIDQIILEKNRTSMSSEWTTTNEDFWRYFGYEKWVNNYIKLPWNLTMQINQGREFTDIWFLFLALLPAILLFLPYRKKYYSFLIVLVLIAELLVFIKTDNNVIDNSKLSTFSKISEESKSVLFQRNDKIFEDKIFNKDIYDINISNYISISDIKSLVNKDNTYSDIESRVKEAFYSEIKSKVLNTDLWETLSINKNKLSASDFEYIKKLHFINTNYSSFNSEITSIASLKEAITKLKLDEYRDWLIDLWKANRTINQIISDFLSSFNLPFWYIIVLLTFIAPILFFLFLLNPKDDSNSESKIVYLFKLNLIFASFYTFLWSISSYWVVWYWITMYFSFLLAIWIWVYYLSSYTDKDDEKVFYTKLFWSLIFSLIVLIYFVNSVFPHTFTNLKTAWYAEYKMWTITTIDAPYLYHQEYLKMLFHLNIDQDKTEEFLKEFINKDIRTIVVWIEKMDIDIIRQILLEIEKKQDLLSRSAKFSLNNIYDNISNPSKKYKSKVWIYRIWTFLKYHISENNIRLLEDGLLFSFSDYIYNLNPIKTIENLEKLWVKYLLADLNAATIDKDERHNLTTRYEKLLKTFVSDKLDLIDTDSICLKIAIEDYKKSEKKDKDMLDYLVIAWVNYESYTSDWKQIVRWTKLLQCYKKVNDLIKNWKVDNKNYNYLLNVSNYMKQNKESFKTEKEIYTLFQQQIPSWFKVLFRIK